MICCFYPVPIFPPKSAGFAGPRAEHGHNRNGGTFERHFLQCRQNAFHFASRCSLRLAWFRGGFRDERAMRRIVRITPRGKMSLPYRIGENSRKDRAHFADGVPFKVCSLAMPSRSEETTATVKSRKPATSASPIGEQPPTAPRTGICIHARNYTPHDCHGALRGPG